MESTNPPCATATSTHVSAAFNQRIPTVRSGLYKIRFGKIKKLYFRITQETVKKVYNSKLVITCEQVCRERLHKGTCSCQAHIQIRQDCTVALDLRF